MARAAKAIRTTLVVVLCAGLLCNLWLLASAALASMAFTSSENSASPMMEERFSATR